MDVLYGRREHLRPVTSQKWNSNQQTGDAAAPQPAKRSPVPKQSPNGFYRSFRLVRKLGEGTFGRVYLAEDNSGSKVAVKKVPRQKQSAEPSTEIKILKQLDHPNVVKMHSHFYTVVKKGAEDAHFLNMVFEYVSDTALYDIIKQFQLPVWRIKRYFYQLCMGLAHIHSRGIMHRDLKPTNIMVNTVTDELKIIDFGSAVSVMTKNNRHLSYIVSRYYRAPELLFASEVYNEKIDIWSLGCILWEMLWGSVLFKGTDTPNQILRIVGLLGAPTKEDYAEMQSPDWSHKFPRVDPVELQSLFPPIYADFASLLEKMLCYNPSKRLSAHEILVDPFFDELRK